MRPNDTPTRRFSTFLKQGREAPFWRDPVVLLAFGFMGGLLVAAALWWWHKEVGGCTVENPF